MSDTTLAKIKEIIEPYIDENGSVDSISLDSNLSDDLHINSAHIIDIVLDVENEFGIEIEDEKIPDIVTIQDVKDIIETSSSS